MTEMYIKLVPNMWGLGSSQRMEVWSFTLAEDEIIIAAKPLGSYHNKFPFAVMEGNFGSDEFAKFGMLEVIRPLTDVMTWLFNTHFYNVRQALNMKMVIDPSKVTVKDVMKGSQPVIRLKPTAYGTDARMAIHQLTLSNVTQGHLQDAHVIEQMIQRATSVVDNVMGMPQQGGRRTATESRQSTGWSTSRLRTPVEYNSALALTPLSQMMISNSQQYMSQNRKYAVAGNMIQTAQGFVMAGPEQIAGNYDFVDVDGTAPIDRLAQANFWKELLMQMSRVPNLAMEWNIGDMIAHAMKLQGERNVDRFRIRVGQPGAVPGANMIPVGGANGGGGQRAGATGTSGGTI